MSIVVETTADPELFVSRCTNWLNTVDAPYHSILSIAYATIDGYASFAGTARFGMLSTNGEICGCWAQVRDGQLHIPLLGNDELDLVCASLFKEDYELRSVSGPTETVLKFCEAWQSETGKQLQAGTEWQLMSADPPLEPAEECRGYMRLAEAKDLERVRSWSALYEEEKPAPMSIADFLTDKLERQQLYLWIDEQPVSMLATTVRIEKQAKLAALFTPRALRGNGYGSMLVRAASNKLFDEGFLSCAIAFDTSDEHLGRLYESIGYRRAGRRLLFTL